MRISLAVAILSLVGSASASAESVLITFSGAVTFSDQPGISVGDLYSGQVVYDTTAPLEPESLNVEFFPFLAGDMLSISVDGCTFSGSTPGEFNGVGIAYHQIFNSQLEGDSFSAVVNSSFDSSCPSLSLTGINFGLVGPPGLLLSDGAPSASGFDLSQVVQPSYSGYGSDAGAFFTGSTGFFGNYTSINVSEATPEPSEWVILISASCGLVLGRMRPALLSFLAR